jgi:hypothetical protein
MENLPRFRDIRGDLELESLDAGKGSLSPDLVVEEHGMPFAVTGFVEIEKMGFDDGTVGPEGGLCPDIGCSVVISTANLGPCGVNAGRREKTVIGRNQVQCGKSKLPASFFSFRHGTRNLERAGQKSVGLCDLSVVDGLSDPGARNSPALIRIGRNGRDGDSERRENPRKVVGRPCTAMAEPESLSDDERDGMKKVPQNGKGKLFGGESLDRLVEGQDGKNVKSELRKDLFFLLRRHDHAKGRFRRKKKEGMGIKGQQQGGDLSFPSHFHQAIQ